MTVRQKKEQKQKDWGLAVDAKIPMVLVTEVDAHIQAILNEIVDGVAGIGIQLVVILPDGEKSQEFCQSWQGKYPAAIKCVSREDVDNDVFDMAIMEEVTVERLKEMKDHNIVPLAERGEVQQFDPVAEKGNAFLFEGDSWSLFAALVRAAETYRFPYDWKNILKSVNKSVD